MNIRKYYSILNQAILLSTTFPHNITNLTLRLRITLPRLVLPSPFHSMREITEEGIILFKI